jgi:ParB-like nuclease domain
MLEKKNDALIAAKAVLARYGGICGMTLHRLVRDPDLNFPKRLLINGRRYWRLSELLAWASAAQMPSILIHAGEITMHPMDVEAMPVASLRPYVRNARTHSRKQIRQIANSIERFGFTNPVLISDDDEIIAGHGRVEVRQSKRPTPLHGNRARQATRSYHE